MYFVITFAQHLFENIVSIYLCEFGIRSDAEVRKSCRPKKRQKQYWRAKSASIQMRTRPSKRGTRASPFTSPGFLIYCPGRSCHRMTSRRLRNKDYKDDASVVDFIKNFHIDILLPRSALMQPQVSKIMRYSVLPFENGPSKGDSHHRATKKYAPRSGAPAT